MEVRPNLLANPSIYKNSKQSATVAERLNHLKCWQPTQNTFKVCDVNVVICESITQSH